MLLQTEFNMLSLRSQLASASVAERRRLLKDIATDIRISVLKTISHAGIGHIGGEFSAADILATLFFGVLRVDPLRPAWEQRDRFILSKGHAASALYATLASRGFFPAEWLDTFGKSKSRLSEHPSPHCAPGVELATGSLGHGLGYGAGLALAGRIQKQSYRVFALMSDGECDEGSVWEASMFIPAHKLDNMAVIIDYNKWQATGRSNEVMALAPLRDKFAAFGWNACEVNGHSVPQLLDALKNVPDGGGKPLAVIAHTVKGKGVSFMEDDNNWHYRIPNDDEVLKAQKELLPA